MAKRKTTLAVIDKQIKSIGTSKAKLAGMVQTTLEMIAEHCFVSDDCTRLLPLIAAVDNPTWQRQINAWLAEFTPMRVRGEKCGLATKFKDERKADADTAIANWWKIDKGAANPFFNIVFDDTVKTETPIGEKELAAFITRNVNSLENMLKNKTIQPQVEGTIRRLKGELNALSLAPMTQAEYVASIGGNTGQFDTLETEETAAKAAA